MTQNYIYTFFKGWTWWKINIRNFIFPWGFETFSCFFPSRALARDGISMKKSRNPKGKWNFWYLFSITFNPWKRYICNFVSSTKLFFFLLGWINLYKNCNLVHILVKLKKKQYFLAEQQLAGLVKCRDGKVPGWKVPGWQSAGMESAGMAKCRDGKCRDGKMPGWKVQIVSRWHGKQFKYQG